MAYFAADQCLTRDDVERHLITSLMGGNLASKEEIEKGMVTYKNNKFAPIGVYRRAFHGHNIWHCAETGEWACHVCDTFFNNYWDGSQEPNNGVHTSFTEMFEYWVKTYVKLWKIKEEK